MKDETAKAGLKKPIYIYATANKGPNGSPSYSFQQIPDSILASMGLSDDFEGE